MKLKDFLNVTKEEFLTYYNNCILFGVNPIEDAFIFVDKTKNVILDPSECQDSEVFVPYFVNTIGRKVYFINGYRGPNRIWNHIKEIDLNRVSTISAYAMYGYYALQTIYAPNLRAIGEQGLTSTTVMELIAPKLERLGAYSLMCSRIEELEFIGKEIDLTTFQFSQMRTVNAKNLEKIKWSGDLDSMQHVPNFLLKKVSNTINIFCGKSSVTILAPNEIESKELIYILKRIYIKEKYI